MALIAPSILAADFSRLADGLKAIEAGGATIVHVDVMDGHFAPEITVGQPVIASLRQATRLKLDVHLLIERPERYVREFAKAGADRIAVHAESTAQLHRVLHLVRESGAEAGLALNTGTAVETVSDVLGEIDFLTLLSADPGRGKRDFVPHSITKMRAAARHRTKLQRPFALQVDGGIGMEDLEELVQEGADILTMGSAIFSYQNPSARLSEMIRLVNAVRERSAS